MTHHQSRIMATDDARISAYLAAHPDASYHAIAKHMGWPKGTTFWRIVRFRETGTVVPTFGRPAQPVTLCVAPEVATFVCDCGAEVVCGWASQHGRRLCSNCRAARIEALRRGDCYGRGQVTRRV